MSAPDQNVAAFPFGGEVSVLFMAGHPVKQVKTPLILNQHFLEVGTKKLVVPVDVNPDGFTAFFQSLRHVSNAAGILVTVPHKEALFSLSDRPTDRARLLGFSNVARIAPDGAIESDCLDGEALLTALRQRNASLIGKTAIVAGCGGAGAAYATALALGGVQEITLMDPDPKRAEVLIATLTKLCPNTQSKLAMVADDILCDIVINASPVGMKSASECAFPQRTIQAASVVVDATTPPWTTKLAATATASRLTVVNGEQLAIAQSENILAYFWGGDS